MNCRFRPVVVKELIHKVLMETLNEKQYSSEQAKTWTKEISDTIITRLKGNKVSCLIRIFERFCSKISYFLSMHIPYCYLAKRLYVILTKSLLSREEPDISLSFVNCKPHLHLLYTRVLRARSTVVRSTMIHVAMIYMKAY